MHTLKQPIYYKMLVSYCCDCKNTAFAGGHVYVVDYKYGGYYEILDAVKDSTTEAISFEDAVLTAFNRDQNVSENGFGGEPGVSMLKLYLGGRHIKDDNLSLDDNTLWEFRYKLQHEEPRVKVVSSSNQDDNDNNTLLLTWNKDFVEE